MVWNQSSQQERTGSPLFLLMHGKRRLKSVGRGLGDGVVVGATAGAGCFLVGVVAKIEK